MGLKTAEPAQNPLSAPAQTSRPQPGGLRFSSSGVARQGHVTFLSAQPVAGTDGAVAPFWSPDSNSIGFVADNKLNSVVNRGGLRRLIYCRPEHTCLLRISPRPQTYLSRLSIAAAFLSSVRGLPRQHLSATQAFNQIREGRHRRAWRSSDFVRIMFLSARLVFRRRH